MYIVLILDFDTHENNFNSFKDLVQGNGYVSNFVLRIGHSHSYIGYFCLSLHVGIQVGLLMIL